MNLNKILLICFGFLLSIEQGFTLVLGRLSSGIERGADVLMPVDLAIYALFLIKPSRIKGSKYTRILNFAKYAAILYWLWSFSGEFVAVERADFRFGFVHLTRAILVFLCVLTRVNTRNDVIAITRGVLYALGLQAFIGVWQWQIGPVVLPFINVINDWRSTGTIGVANAFGLYIAAISPIAIRMAMFTKLKPRWLWIVISVLAMGSLFASFTRGAWLAFGLSMIVFFYLDFRKRKLSKRQIYVLVSAAIISLSFTAIKYGHIVTGRMEGAKEAIVSNKKHSRWGLAKDSFRIIKAYPVFGVGLNNYRYHSDPEIQGTRIVHNAFLLIAAQQGVPGFLIFMILHIIIFIKGLKILKSRDPVLYHIGAAGLTGLLTLLLYYMVAPDYRLVPIKLQHWRILAMVGAILIANDRVERSIYLKSHAKKIRERMV